MDSYGKTLLGPLICQRLATLPTWASTDEGRFIYVNDTDKTYFGTGASWVEFGGGGSVVVKNSGYTIPVIEAGTIYTCTSSDLQSFSLPSVDTINIGIEFTIVKLGTGRVQIMSADSDVIEDSGAGLYIYCEDTTIATITLKLISATQWIIKNGANGIWITTI